MEIGKTRFFRKNSPPCSAGIVFSHHFSSFSNFHSRYLTVYKRGICFIFLNETHHCNFQAQFEQLENEMKDSNGNFEAMKKGLLELTELKHILRKTQVFFEEVRLIYNKRYEVLPNM